MNGVKKYPELLDDTDLRYEKYSATITAHLGVDPYFDNDTILLQFERLFKLIQLKEEYQHHIIEILVDNDVGYPGSGFAYFPLRFAHKGDQNRIKRDQDRTRRALSNALFTFPLMSPQTQEKSKILSKNNEKPLHIL